MHQIIDFINCNYQWLLPIVLSIVEFFILFIFRRGIRTFHFDSHLYDDIISAIKLAEERWPHGHGGNKHQFVRDFIKEKYGDDFYSMAESLIDRMIYRVLDCPQRKEDK